MQPDPKQASHDKSELTRRHRAIVWPLIVLASLLLVFSITANWVQSALLDTDQVTKTTDKILQDKDVQEQLSIFAVDQLYANVDVQGQIEKELPPPRRRSPSPSGRQSGSSPRTSPRRRSPPPRCSNSSPTPSAGRTSGSST